MARHRQQPVAVYGTAANPGASWRSSADFYSGAVTACQRWSQHYRSAMQASSSIGFRRAECGDLRAAVSFVTAHGKRVLARAEGPIIPPDDPSQVGEWSTQHGLLPRAIIYLYLDFREARGRPITSHRAESGLAPEFCPGHLYPHWLYSSCAYS